MSSSKFFDEYEPVVAKQAVHDNVADLFGGTSSIGGVSSFLSTTSRKEDEISAYTLFNYLAVTRIALKGSQQFPMLGIPTDLESSQNFDSSRIIKMSLSDKRNLIRCHGGRIIQSQSQEVEALPNDHPLLLLLRSVNTVDWWQSFMFEILLFFELTGEAYIWVVPSMVRSENAENGLPNQMWVIPTQWVAPKYEKSGRLKAYRVTPNGNTRKRKDIDPDEIIPILMKNPRDKNRGYSPSTAGGPWIDSNEEIERSRQYVFRNSITPSVWLKILSESNIDPKDHETLDRIKARWMQRASGVEKTREPVIVPPGIEIDASGNFKPKEMDYGASSTEVRDNILALRGVNKFVAGFTEGMNRAQVETALVQFCEFHLNPTLAMVAGALQEKLVPKFDSRIRLWFEDCAPDNRQQRLEELKFLSTMGLHPNEARGEFGLESVDDEDYNTGYIPGGLVPLGVNPSDGLPKDESGEEEPEDSTEQAALDIYGRQRNGNGRTDHASFLQ